MEQTILIVEDDNDLRENICSILQNEGFQTLEAVNGTQALKKLIPSISLVILDIMMPGISGIETCQKIRNFSYVPILFLTARASESDKVHGFYAGGDDYLTKPFSYVELVARVRASQHKYNGNITTTQCYTDYKSTSGNRPRNYSRTNRHRI